MIRCLAIGLLLLPACGGKSDVHTYDNSLFELASGFSAKQVCSCVFVSGRDPQFCKEWTRVSPNVARFKIDEEAMTVTSRALGMGKQVAHYHGDGLGCTLEPR